MKNHKFLFSLVIIFMTSGMLFGQATIEANHPVLDTEYLGWDEDTEFPLYIRHKNNKAIVFETNAVERMRMEGDGRLRVGDNIPSSSGVLSTFYTQNFATALRANTTGNGPLNIAGVFRAGDGVESYGVRGFASSTVPGTLNFGVAGIVCGDGTNYAVYGEVCDTAGSFAGYFDGNVYTTANYETSDENLKTDILNPEGVAGL